MIVIKILILVWKNEDELGIIRMCDIIFFFLVFIDENIIVLFF